MKRPCVGYNPVKCKKCEGSFDKNESKKNCYRPYNLTCSGSGRKHYPFFSNIYSCYLCKKKCFWLEDTISNEFPHCHDVWRKDFWKDVQNRKEVSNGKKILTFGDMSSDLFFYKMSPYLPNKDLLNLLVLSKDCNRKLTGSLYAQKKAYTNNTKYLKLPDLPYDFPRMTSDENLIFAICGKRWLLVWDLKDISTMPQLFDMKSDGLIIKSIASKALKASKHHLLVIPYIDKKESSLIIKFFILHRNGHNPDPGVPKKLRFIYEYKHQLNLKPHSSSSLRVKILDNNKAVCLFKQTKCDRPHNRIFANFLILFTSNAQDNPARLIYKSRQRSSEITDFCIYQGCVYFSLNDGRVYLYNPNQNMQEQIIDNPVDRRYRLKKILVKDGKIITFRTDGSIAVYDTKNRKLLGNIELLGLGLKNGCIYNYDSVYLHKNALFLGITTPNSYTEKPIVILFPEYEVHPRISSAPFSIERSPKLEKYKRRGNRFYTYNVFTLMHTYSYGNKTHLITGYNSRNQLWEMKRQLIIWDMNYLLSEEE